MHPGLVCEPLNTRSFVMSPVLSCRRLLHASAANFFGKSAGQILAMVLIVVAGVAAPLRSDAGDFAASNHLRQTIYHAPQKPGFTSWVGAWTMPDGSLMVSF